MEVLLLYVAFKLKQEVKILYVDLLEAINMLLGGFDFSDSTRPRTAPKTCFFLGSFSYVSSLFLANQVWEVEIQYIDFV